MTECLVRMFGREIPSVPRAVIKNTRLIVCQLLSLQFRLFMASKPLHILDYKFAKTNSQISAKVISGNGLKFMLFL